MSNELVAEVAIRKSDKAMYHVSGVSKLDGSLQLIGQDGKRISAKSLKDFVFYTYGCEKRVYID